MKFDRLKLLRDKRGLSQERASKMMGIVRSTYANYEAGNREPDNDTLKKFSEFFEVSTDYLIGNDTIKNNNDHEKNDELLDILSRLPQDKKRLVIEIAKSYLGD